MTSLITATDHAHLSRCVDLARRALDSGDEPFGSVLVSDADEVLFEDHNRVAGGDQTRHPEIAIARWAAARLAPEERARATVYTSGEHCPMCAAAHGFVGLGRIVYATSSAQLSQWLTRWSLAAPPVAMLPIANIAPHVPTTGPVPEFADAIRQLHAASRGIPL